MPDIEPASYYCYDCEERHTGDCPRPECYECSEYHRPADECPRWYCEDCDDYHDTGQDCPRPYCGSCGEYHPIYDEWGNYWECGYASDYLQCDNPPLRFHGKGPAFYGLEVEVTSHRVGSAVSAAQSLDHNGLLWFKDDCSVDGFEMACHPMSYEYAMAEFPWDVLTEFADHGCQIIPETNGIHVHVSRKAFNDDAHAYRWMKLFYRNQNYVISIARRDSRWGHFSSDHRRGHANHLKAAKAARKGDYYKARSFNDSTRERYSVINTTNDDTFEVRVFASTLNVREAQAALQLVAAGVEYTRTLTVADIVHHEGWTWPAFGCWLKAQGEKYGALVAMTDAYDAAGGSRATRVYPRVRTEPAQRYTDIPSDDCTCQMCRRYRADADRAYSLLAEEF